MPGVSGEKTPEWGKERSVEAYGLLDTSNRENQSRRKGRRPAWRRPGPHPRMSVLPLETSGSSEACVRNDVMRLCLCLRMESLWGRGNYGNRQIN